MIINNLINKISKYKNIIFELKKILNIDNKIKDKEHIQKIMTTSLFWNDKNKAQKYIDQLNILNFTINTYEKIQNKINKLDTNIKFILKSNNTQQNINKYIINTEILLKELKQNINNFEITHFFSEKYDNHNVYLSIYAGAGGTESCDWTSMLSKMYEKWAKNKGLTIKIINFTPGEEIGFKNITILINGIFAYGYLKSEHGVHRLIRISPFDSKSRRHTSFALVEIIPKINEEKFIINDKDLKIDTYKSSGAGGQSVNTTDSAVRITHIPTKTIVSCQNERSQHKNKAIAMNILKSKLQVKNTENQKLKMNLIKGNKIDICWGNQIRSYVLYPYKMVKDLRTMKISYNPESVLNGNINSFIESYIKINNQNIYNQ